MLFATWCLQDCLNWCMQNTLYRTYVYNRLPEDEPSGSKHVEDIKIKNEIINLEEVYFVDLYCKIV